MPALVSTLCICIVFIPMFFLSGVARYLFIPLAEAVVFAMLASYVLSRTLVPTLAMYMLKAHTHRRSAQPKSVRNRCSRAFDHGFERLRDSYPALLGLFAGGSYLCLHFCWSALRAFLLFPWLGEDFFPSADAGQFKLHVRAKTGTRIEETARLCDLVEAAIRRHIPQRELASVLDIVGLPISSINTIYSNSAPIGSGDADIFVSLNPGHRPTRRIRARSPRILCRVNFPGRVLFSAGRYRDADPQFRPAGPDRRSLWAGTSRRTACSRTAFSNQLRRVPGIADLRIQQRFDRPASLEADRTKAAQAVSPARHRQQPARYAQRQLSDAAHILAESCTGVTYSLVTQTPQYDIRLDAGHQQHPASARSRTARRRFWAIWPTIHRAALGRCRSL